MTELTTIDTNNYVAMAKAMGIANEGSTNKQKSSTLPRLKINHSAIMGEGEVNGKTVCKIVDTKKIDGDIFLHFCDKSISSLELDNEYILEVNIEQQINNIEKNYTFLATVGSTAPFIGLFGTVWGIMNSFQSIAISRNTSLAIVAPGIAEALFATALGLLAAIPAVVAYNKFNSDARKYSNKLEDFSKRFLAII